jgi:hypothetical protein
MADQIEGAIKTVLGVGWIEPQGRDGVAETFVALRAAEVQSNSRFPARDEDAKARAVSAGFSNRGTKLTRFAQQLNT